MQRGIGVGPGREDGRHQGIVHADLGRLAVGEGEDRVVREDLEVERHRSVRPPDHVDRDRQRRLRQQRSPAERDGAGGLALLSRSEHPLRPLLDERRPAIGDPLLRRLEGRRNSVRFSSRGQRRTSSSIISVDSLVTVTTISPPSAPTCGSTVTATTRSSALAGQVEAQRIGLRRGRRRGLGGLASAARRRTGPRSARRLRRRLATASGSRRSRPGGAPPGR